MPKIDKKDEPQDSSDEELGFDEDKHGFFADSTEGYDSEEDEDLKAPPSFAKSKVGLHQQVPVKQEAESKAPEPKKPGSKI